MDFLQRAQLSSPSDARAALRAALNAAPDSIWVARNAARIFRTHVRDPESARAVLDHLAPLTCLEWRLVAAAWHELGDDTATRGCLERAANNARVSTDLCHVAMGYRDSGYEDEALLLVDGAARLASRAMDVWVVASCYRDAFSDPNRARDTLVRGMREAVGVAEILELSRAFAAHGAEAEELAGFVARAERIASTVHDWIELSIAQHVMLVDAEEALRCVNQASRMATSPQDERDIAVARSRLHIQLLDDERPRLPPSKLLRSGARSFAWDRDANRLLGWLRARIPRTSIDSLARPDQFFANDDLVTMLELQKTGAIPHPLPAYLENLARYRSRTGAGVDHQLRAFACVVYAVDDAAGFVSDGIETTLVTLLESAFVLGPDAVSAAAALFAALADSFEASRSTTADAYLVLFCELGLLIAATWLDPTDPRIAPLAHRMIEDEKVFRTNDGPWLFSLSKAPPDPWRALAKRVPLHPSIASLI